MTPLLRVLVAIPSLLMLITCLAHLILLQWESLREEKHLIALHGEVYRQYSRHTGRFFPRSIRAYAHS